MPTAGRLAVVHGQRIVRESRDIAQRHHVARVERLLQAVAVSIGDRDRSASGATC